MIFIHIFNSVIDIFEAKKKS